MRRIIISSIPLLALLLVLGTSVQVDAQSSAIPCGPFVQPGVCTPPFHRGDQLFIRQGVPFVWLRAMPSSYGHVITTVRPSGIPVLEVLSYPPEWDGYQSWYFVMPVGNSLVNGWVEQASLTSAPIIVPTPVIPPKASWSPPLTASLKPSLPFGWLRLHPSSYVASVYTVYPGTLFTVMDTPNASFDGVQWWWPVRVLIPGSAVTGWLEQGSILPTSTVPTPVPVPIVRTAAAFQAFENGYMIWTESDQQIYVFYGVTGGADTVYPLWSYGTLPDNPISTPAPQGRVKPIRGFGRVWGNYPAVRNGLGWGLQSEQGYTATITTMSTYPYTGSTVRITLPDGRAITITGNNWFF